MIQASIIIATYNRAERLRACMEALNHQTQPAADFEVIVVVDGSTDRTREMLSAFRTPYVLRVITQANSGQSVAFNRGIDSAEGRICIFLDDDIITDPHFVSQHLQLHSRRERVVGIGQITLRLLPRADWFSRRFAQEWSEHYGLLNTGKQVIGWQDCYCGNMSVPRSSFDEIGGFGILPRGNDIEIGFRLQQQGYKLVYLPRAQSEQDHRKNKSALVKDSGASGIGSVEIYRRHPSTLPVLLGRFGEQRPRLAAALRLLLTVDPQPKYVEMLGTLLVKLIGSTTAYDLIQRYAYWRAVHHALPSRDDWDAILGGVPILMYHAFGAPGARASRFVLPIRRFEHQMVWLKRWRYQVISLEDLLSYWRSYRLPPPHTVAITIDDGYADTALAEAVLRRFNFPATTFLVSDRVGRANDWDSAGELTGRPLLSWADVKEMKTRGMGFGSHTCTHPDLTAQGAERAREEIESSRRKLEDKLGVPVRVFSYPYGLRTKALEELTDEAGYWGSCSIDTGRNTPATPLQRLRRVEIHGTDSILEFAHAVHFGTEPFLWNRILRKLPGPRAVELKET